jgi:hypothetical protein
MWLIIFRVRNIARNGEVVIHTLSTQISERSSNSWIGEGGLHLSAIMITDYSVNDEANYNFFTK